MIGNFYATLKSGSRAAFFLLSTLAFSANVYAKVVLDDFLARAFEKNLSQSAVWLALLHSDGHGSDIKDPSFFLSRSTPSSQNELKATLEFLYQGNSTNVCRFPARYTWLKTQLALPALPLSSCTDLHEFVDKAPNQQMSLVFASESLTQPASMMGHSFFKLSGRSAKGMDVSHAVTFFTEAGGYNLPKLFFESTVTGKPGFFALSPFDDELQRYLSGEQRAVWVFDLDLDPATLQLIQLHFQELKQTQLLYFFQSYNCATLLRHVLRLSGRLVTQGGPWVTPKDVVQDVHRSGLVKHSVVHQPHAALVRAIAGQLPAGKPETVGQAVRQGDIDATFFGGSSAEDQLTRVMASTYAEHLALQKPDDRALRRSIEKLSALQRQHSDQQLSSPSHLNPAGHPPDSQFSLSQRSAAVGKKMLLSLLPASHLLMDDNRAYAQETELQLMKTTLSIDENMRLALDQLTLYKMQSYPAHDPLIGALSTKALVQWGSNPHDKSDAAKGWYVSAAFGRTQRWMADIDGFALLGAGLGHFKSSTTLPLTAEVGLIVRELGNMKTTASYQWRREVLGPAFSTRQLQLEQSKYLGRHHAVFARWRQLELKAGRSHEWELGLKYLF